MKRVKIILAAVLVLLVAAILFKGSGIARLLIDPFTGSQALAQPEQSQADLAEGTPALESPSQVEQAEDTSDDSDAAVEPDDPQNDDAQSTDAGDVDDDAVAEQDESADPIATSADPNQQEAAPTGPRRELFDPSAMRQFAAQGDPNRPAMPFDRDRMRDMGSRTPEGRRGRGADAPSQGQAAGSPDEPMEAINLNNVEMKKIVQTLGEWTGKPIIPTSDDIMNTKITIYATKQVPRSQAMALILAALKAKGVIVEQSDDKILLKPIASAKIGSVPTLSPDEPLARITDKTQIVEKFYRLTNYSPTKLMAIVTPLIAEYGHVTALEDTGQIAVIDSVENLLRVERIIRQLDVPESEQVVEEIFTLENGDPVEVVQVLQLILDTERRSRTTARQPGPTSSTGSQSGQARPAMSVVVAQGDIPVRLLPIPKHNWIIARASALDIEQIRGWIKKLDRVESVPSEQTIVQVRYVDPREVANIIENTLRNTPGVQYRTSVVVQPLVQARQIVIFGSEENRKMVEKLIAEVDLPIDDVFVEKTFKLKYADPDLIKQNVEGLYGDPTMSGRTGGFNYGYQYGRTPTRPGASIEDSIVKVIAYPTQQQITVIASEKNMLKIERQIVDEWDVPIDIEKDQYRILTVHNSDPVQMSNLLTKLFSEDGSAGSRDLMRMIFGGRTDTQKKIVGSLYGMLTFEPVPETKKIIVISKIPEAYDVIEKLVNELDSEEKAEVPRVITLNYADAEDLCDQLNAILNESGTLATLNRSTRGLSAYSGGGESDSATARAGGGAAAGAATGGTITPWWTRQRTAADQGRPTSNLIGRVRFIPVARSKAVLVLAPPEYITDIEHMIAELDQPGMQVMIKVVIVEVDHASMTSLGVQLSSGNVLRTNIGPDALLALTQMATGFSRGMFTFDAGMDVDVLIDALSKTVNAKVLNQPTLWTKDNQEAIFVKGQRVAFIQQRSTDRQTTGSTVETFSYDDVGLTLRVRPNITPEKAVDMSINLIVSQVGENVNNQLATNQLDTTTHVIVNDGQTILLGGILFQNDNLVVNKVPLLGDVPVLGALFTHKNNTLRNNELLAFVTPYVMDANSLAEIPVDLDDSRQLHEPRQKMERIQRDLNDATDWMSEQIIREMDQAKPFYRQPTEREVEIKPLQPVEPAPESDPAETLTVLYPLSSRNPEIIRR